VSRAVTDAVTHTGEEPATGGRGRERAERADRGPRLPEQRPFRQPQMRLNHTEILSADELESIHDASLTILERIGMEFLCPESRRIVREAGADVDEATNRVRFPRELIERAITTAPSEFTLHSWNPAHDVHIGGRWMAFGTVASAPHYIDRHGVRKTGDREGFRDLLKLAQMLDTSSTTSAAIRSSRSTSTRRSGTSRPRGTSSRSPTRGSTATASAASATSTRSRWCGSPAASTSRRWSANRR
jgi:trimethylamine---corrinoid protein Co-methyltransferase